MDNNDVLAIENYTILGIILELKGKIKKSIRRVTKSKICDSILVFQCTLY